MESEKSLCPIGQTNVTFKAVQLDLVTKASELSGAARNMKAYKFLNSDSSYLFMKY
jgi:hypothetical protein